MLMKARVSGFLTRSVCPLRNMSRGERDSFLLSLHFISFPLRLPPDPRQDRQEEGVPNDSDNDLLK